MTTSVSVNPRVVSQEEWLAARTELLKKEKELTHARDAISAQRRALPIPVDISLPKKKTPAATR